MKHNFMTKMVSALLAVVLSTAAFSVTAFASGGEENTESVTEQETAGDVSDLLSALEGSQITVSVTEDGIQFSSGENDSGQTGTVTTDGGNLNVRTGAGMDYTAFTQLPNGTTVKVIGTDGDWLKVILPEKVGYVYSGYMTVSDGEAGSGEGSFSLDAETLENLHLTAVYEAFDMDKLRNPQVVAARKRLRQMIADCGLPCRTLLWNETCNGIDDYLAAQKIC